MPKKTTSTKSTIRKASNRKLKSPTYSSFRLQKRIKHNRAILPPARKFFASCIQHLWQHKRLYILIGLVQGILVFVLVRNFSVSTSLSAAKELLEEVLSGTSGKLLTGTALFGTLLESNSAATAVGATYQSAVLLVVSLALIWGLRQTYAGVSTSLRDVFYKGMAPLVPYLLVLSVMALQTVPLILANMLYSFVFGNQLAATTVEQVLWSLLIFLLVIFTLYMLTSSIFALVIVTLPDMTPLRALRSARKLVLYRRWTVMRKLIFLPFALLLIGAFVMVPVILFVTPLAEWLYFILATTAFLVTHSYIYSVYRELLK